MLKYQGGESASPRALLLTSGLHITRHVSNGTDVPYTSIDNTVFRLLTPCGTICRIFRKTCCLHVYVFFYREEGDIVFPRNICKFQPNQVTSQGTVFFTDTSVRT